MLTRKNSLYIIIPALIIAAFSSCKKSELTKFDSPAMVHFYKRFDNPSRDSSLYSFAIRTASLMKDTVKLPVRISGLATNRDLTFNVKSVADSTTAVEGTDYTIHSSVVAAGKYSDSLVLIVHRKPDMKNKEKRLLLEIVPSSDLLPGLFNTPSADGQVKLTGGSIRTLVIINDFLTKPANWDANLVFFFGTYSRVKYQFIIDVTGRAEFPFGPTGLPYGQFTAYQNMMRQALSDYVKVNGNMIDENEQVVTF